MLLCASNNNTIITADMNLDLLKIGERKKFQAYFDLFVIYDLFPQIMYPSWVAQVSRTALREIKRGPYQNDSDINWSNVLPVEIHK